MLLLPLASAHVPFHRGDVVITELDARPAVDGGQWFEVVNTTAGTLNLVEQVYTDADGDTFQVSLTLLVRAGESAIFASTESTIAADYPLPDGFDLPTDAGAVVHTDLTGVIDEVRWDTSWGLGAPLQLDGTLIGEFPNDLRRNWCSIAATPRATNLPCPGSDTDDDGDGWTEAAGDCHDGDATIHPGATDAPDVPDDADCDGERDEDPLPGDTGDTGDSGQTIDTAETGDTANPDTAAVEDTADTAARGDSAPVPQPTPHERVCAGWLVLLLPLGALRSRRSKA